MSALERARQAGKLERRQGGPLTPAVYRLAVARSVERSVMMGWCWSTTELTLDAPGSMFTLTAKVHDDTDSRWDDDDVFGRFTTEAEPGVTVESPRRHAPSWAETDPYYIPGYSIADRYAHHRANGASRAVAREWAVSGAETEAGEACEREFHGVEVVASLDGVPMGDAALWGIDGDPHYLADVAMDLAPEAVHNALAELERRYGPNGRQMFLTPGVAA